MNTFTRELSNKENCISSSPSSTTCNFENKELKFFNKITNYDDMEIIHKEEEKNKYNKNSDFQMEELIIPDNDDGDNDDTALEINTWESNHHHHHHHHYKNYDDDNENAINLKVCRIASEKSHSNLPPMEEPELVPIEGTENAVISLKNHNAYLINPLITNDDDPLNVVSGEQKGKQEEKPSHITLQNNSKSKGGNDADDLQVLQIHYTPIILDSDDDHNRLQPSEKFNVQKQLDSLTFQISKDITITAINTTKPRRAPPTNHQFRKSVSPTATINERNSTSPGISSVVPTIDLIDSSEEESTTSAKSIRKSKSKAKRCLLTDEMSQKQVLDYATTLNNIKQTSQSLSSSLSAIRSTIKREPPTAVILPPPTAQSDFLSAVNLQPIPIGINPYSSQSFYPQKTAAADIPPLPTPYWQQQYNISWLEYFIKQFANPQLLATHACYAFLQRALKYKEFARIKAERLELDVKFQENQSISNSYLDNNLKWSLQQIFFKNSKELSKQGKRFCELISRRTLKPITLLSNVCTGKVALKTLYINPRIFNYMLSDKTNVLNENSYLTNPNNTMIAGVAPSWTMTGTTSVPRKRHCNDEDEYMPSKSVGLLQNTIANGVAERKLSLRTKRTRRLDSNFSYNEELSDDVDADAEADAETAAAAAIAASRADIQKRVDEKRLEAQLQRMRQVKSFENEFVQVLGKHIKLETTKLTNTTVNNNKTNSSYSQQILPLSMENYPNKLESGLLRNTWLAHRRGESTKIVDNLQGEHDDYSGTWSFNLQQRTTASYEKFSAQSINSSPNRLHQYQTNNTKLNRYQLVKSRGRRKKNFSISPNGDKLTVSNNVRIVDGVVSPIDSKVAKSQWPKNIDINMHINGRSKGVCVICKLNAQRMVQHYVNEHRGCEIYISRLTIEQIDALKFGQANLASISIYKNGQNQYKANCIFCEKPSRFMLPYWYQHFTMHTGEYAYRCTVCGVRKPTRSLLSQYHAQPYPCTGDITQDYVFDSKAKQIEACLCTLCNYVQLQRRNIIMHLQQQHSIQHIQSEHIDTIVLLKTKATPPLTTSAEKPVMAQEKLSETETETELKEEATHSNHSVTVNNRSTYNLMKDNKSEHILANEKKGFLDYIPPSNASTAALASI